MRVMTYRLRSPSAAAAESALSSKGDITPLQADKSPSQGDAPFSEGDTSGPHGYAFTRKATKNSWTP